MPDLSSVTGWDTRWSIPVNAEIESTVVEAYIGSDYFLDQTSIFYYFMEISPGELYQNMEDGDWVAILM
jgi:hypothetical protein